MKYTNIRAKIKELSELQVLNKQQRKESYKGERTMAPYDAAVSVESIRNELMHLFRAYAELKGFRLPLPTKKVVFQELVDRYIEMYYVAPVVID